MNPRFHDIGAYIKGVKALTPNVVLTSVGGGVEQPGDDIDREGLNRLFLSTKLMVPYEATGLTAAMPKTFLFPYTIIRSHQVLLMLCIIVYRSLNLLKGPLCSRHD